MDLKNILDDEKDMKKNPNVKIHKKPIQLKDIERRSRNNILKAEDYSETDINKLIDLEKGHKFNQSWSRLDRGSKVNRLILYSQKCTEEYNLTEEENKKLQKLLLHGCNKNKFNKVSEINYDKGQGFINDIKTLEFNEETRTFSLKITETKSKPKNSSKSNIERLLKQ